MFFIIIYDRLFIIFTSIFKNIFRIIINRVLNFKKESKTKNGDTKVNHFFDMLTMIGILSSVASIVVKIPGFDEWFKKVLGKIFDFGIAKSSAAETSLKFDKDVLKVSGNGGESENLGSFESVKKLLDNAENMEYPVYGTSNDTITSFTGAISTGSNNEFSEKFIQSITNVSKSSMESDLMYATKNSISDDGIITSITHMFTTSSQNSSLIDGNLTRCSTLKEFCLNFVQLHDGESNIGFMIQSRLIEGASTDENFFVKGILSATGKILKIEEIVGANADTIVGKQWDELSNLLVK